MLKGLTTPVIFFITAILATSLLFGGIDVEFGTVNFFHKHSVLFLICIAIFPRLTLLFSSVPFGGVLWWLGFIFAPRLLVAVLATIAYGKTNPILVAVAWIVALSGETMEKRKLSGSKRFVVRTYRAGGFGTSDEEVRKQNTIGEDGVIEAEFTKKD